MFAKINVSNNLSSRQMVGYKEDMSYLSRLKKSKAIDLRNNSTTIDLGNGYTKTLPIDKNKLYK